MKDKIKNIIKEYWAKAGHMQGVLVFMLVLFISNFLWKIVVSGDEGSNQVLLFDAIDVSGPFDYMVAHITYVVKFILSSLGFNIHGHYANDICFDNHNSLLVIWGCTAIKQSFIFLSIMLFTQGPWKPKIWFVPLGLFLVYFFNIFRIFILSVVVENHPDRFNFLHETIKYVFYGVIFLYWMIWEERINQRRKKILS